MKLTKYAEQHRSALLQLHLCASLLTKDMAWLALAYHISTDIDSSV